jgi:hypothetical protein
MEKWVKVRNAPDRLWGARPYEPCRPEAESSKAQARWSPSYKQVSNLSSSFVLVRVHRGRRTSEEDEEGR